MRPKMQDLKVEEAHVILMNQKFRLIKSIRLSQGGISEVSVDIRILLKETILNNATVIAFCHNHPSGNTRPSAVDDKLTQCLKKACDCMRIHFLDHVIVCDGQYYSYAENGRL
jgi:DNA repair protein RadC